VGAGYAEEAHYLRVHVAHIRRKLDRDPSRPQIVLTAAGVGCRLAPEA
jgi:two-component system, OmpR family, KDP operon response regulator KdpE